MGGDRDEPVGPVGAPGARAGRPAELEGILADVIPALAARLRASRLAELEVRTTDWRVRVRREPDAALPPSRPVPARPGAHIRGATPAGVGGADHAGVARSPAVGYFMPAPSAVVGRAVRNGDLLGQVEMLGIGHDVSSPTDGIIIRSLAAAGEAVEYGQPLVLVEAGASLRAGAGGAQSGDVTGSADDTAVAAPAATAATAGTTGTARTAETAASGAGAILDLGAE